MKSEEIVAKEMSQLLKKEQAESNLNLSQVVFDKMTRVTNLTLKQDEDRLTLIYRPFEPNPTEIALLTLDAEEESVVMFKGLTANLEEKATLVKINNPKKREELFEAVKENVEQIKMETPTKEFFGAIKDTQRERYENMTLTQQRILGLMMEYLQKKGY